VNVAYMDGNADVNQTILTADLVKTPGDPALPGSTILPMT